jgi:hypothetical protein
LTLKPSSLNEFGNHGFVGFLLALYELPVMTCDNAVTKPHIGRVLSFSQQLKFRGAFSVQPHAHKTVQHGHGTSRQNADKYDNEFYVKNRQSALTFPTFSTCIHTTKGLPYRSGEVPHWVKVKEPQSVRNQEQNPHRRVVALAEPCIGGGLPTAGSTTTIAAQESGTWGTRAKPLAARSPCLPTALLI